MNRDRNPTESSLGAAGDAFVWLCVMSVWFWADPVAANPGSSTGGSSSTGSTGIAGGVSAAAIPYLWFSLGGGVLGLWLALQRSAVRWSSPWSSVRNALGILVFAGLAFQLADFHGALLWLAVSLTTIWNVREPKNPMRRVQEAPKRVPSWVRTSAPELGLVAAWLLHHAELPVFALLLGPVWLSLVLSPKGALERSLPLLAASLCVFLLGLREVLDPLLARAMATASGWALTATGAAVHVDGATLLGVGAPVHVTASCAGSIVTLTPFAIGVTLSALLQAPKHLQWLAGVGLLGVAAVLNWARILGVTLSGLWWNVEEMQLFHDVIGWPLAALLYGGFALWLRRNVRALETR